MENKTNKRPVVYIGAPISNTGFVMYVNRVAGLLRDIGYEVYSAIEDESINDKTNDPSPEQIFNNDLKGILQADIFLFLETGGIQIGTHVELGIVLGRISMGDDIKLIGFTNNQRLENPQIKDGYPSASMNHLALGGVLEHGKMFNNEEGFVKQMIDMAHDEYKFVSLEEKKDMLDRYGSTGEVLASGSIVNEEVEDDSVKLFAVRYITEEGEEDFVREKSNAPRIFGDYDTAYRSSQQFDGGKVVRVSVKNCGDAF